jgi:hypothetical protein
LNAAKDYKAATRRLTIHHVDHLVGGRGKWNGGLRWKWRAKWKGERGKEGQEIDTETTEHTENTEQEGKGRAKK